MTSPNDLSLSEFVHEYVGFYSEYHPLVTDFVIVFYESVNQNFSTKMNKPPLAKPTSGLHTFLSSCDQQLKK